MSDELPEASADLDGLDLDDLEELELGELKRVTLRPGDRLIVMQEIEMDRTQRGLLVHRLEQWAPGYPVMILPPGVTLGVLGVEEPEDDGHSESV